MHLLNFTSGITLAVLPDFSLNKVGESYGLTPISGKYIKTLSLNSY